jgi:hypothetical protein
MCEIETMNRNQIQLYYCIVYAIVTDSNSSNQTLYDTIVSKATGFAIKHHLLFDFRNKA